jgi:hypothetical protein
MPSWQRQSACLVQHRASRRTEFGGNGRRLDVLPPAALEQRFPLWRPGQIDRFSGTTERRRIG